MTRTNSLTFNKLLHRWEASRGVGIAAAKQEGSTERNDWGEGEGKMSSKVISKIKAVDQKVAQGFEPLEPKVAPGFIWIGGGHS